MVLANRDKTSDADKPNTAVQTDAQGEVNEQEIEDKLNELDENADNEDNVTDDDASGVDSDGEPEITVYTVSDKIKNADLSSGLVQLNGDIMQVGGYIKTSDFYANMLTNTVLYTATEVTMRIKRAKCSTTV